MDLNNLDSNNPLEGKFFMNKKIYEMEQKKITDKINEIEERRRKLIPSLLVPLKSGKERLHRIGSDESEELDKLDKEQRNLEKQLKELDRDFHSNFRGV